MTMYN